MRKAEQIAAGIAVGMLSTGLACAAYGADRPQGSSSHSGPARWSYSGPGGPANWGSLSPDYRACSSGRMQSPINLADGFPAKGPPLAFDYGSTPLKVVNTGHTAQVNCTPGSTVTVAGEVYQLLQFHFHAPSEHAVAGARAPMEAHFVHRNTATGTLTVIGVTILEGGRNAALAPVFAAIPSKAGSSAAIADATIDLSALLPPDAGAYFHYSGSLTTPPCNEGVRWFVLAKPIRASRDQIAAFQRVFGPNARPLQGRYGRLLVAPP